MNLDQARRMIGENVAARRKELGMTQVALARAVGISQPAIVAIEKGKISPSLETLLALADALQTTLSGLTTPGIFSGSPA